MTREPGESGALLRLDQPWRDAELARLYDAFPFDADIPLYRGLAARQGGCVLEVCCGTGRVLLPLAAAGNRVTGLDASAAMLALAAGKLHAAGAVVESRVHLVEGDMRSFDLDAVFDLAIIAVKSFAYLTRRNEQQEALATVAAHLRPGGLLAIDLLNPSPTWLLEPPGSVRQDLVQYVPAMSATIVRDEAVVGTDTAEQIRTIRSAYEIIADDGSVRKRLVEWPFRYTCRYEAELLLERAGFKIEDVYGGYRCEPFTGESSVMLLLARKP